MTAPRSRTQLTATEGETAEELIAYALSKQQAITRAQLGRRHRAGIIPAKQVVRRDGRRTWVNPAGSKELLVIGWELEEQHRSLDRVRP